MKASFQDTTLINSVLLRASKVGSSRKSFNKSKNYCLLDSKLLTHHSECLLEVMHYRGK